MILWAERETPATDTLLVFTAAWTDEEGCLFINSFFAFGRCWLDVRGICRSRLCCATACLARGGIWQHSNDSLQIRRYLSLSLMFRDESEGGDL